MTTARDRGREVFRDHSFRPFSPVVRDRQSQLIMSGAGRIVLVDENLAAAGCGSKKSDRCDAAGGAYSRSASEDPVLLSRCRASSSIGRAFSRCGADRGLDDEMYLAASLRWLLSGRLAASYVNFQVISAASECIRYVRFCEFLSVNEGL